MIEDLIEGDGDDMLDVALEELLEAHLAEQLIQDEADAIEDVFEDIDADGGCGGLANDGDDDNADDAGHLRPAQNPSALNHMLGPFRYTMKHKADKFSWQCSCPFHRKNSKSGCRKTIVLQLGKTSFEAESDRVLCILQHWANQALKYGRQRHHVALDINDENVPSVGVLKAQAIEHPPRERPQTDVVLDGGDDALAMAASSDDGGNKY